MSDRSYEELSRIDNFTDRLEYLKLRDEHTKSPRRVSGDFFRTKLWRDLRSRIMVRDGRFDLGIFGVYIDGPVYIHHINPITEEDLESLTPKVIDPNNLVCVSMETHNAIHYKPEKEEFVERVPGDTKFW